jgi:hypothetical protein
VLYTFGVLATAIAALAIGGIVVIGVPPLLAIIVGILLIVAAGAWVVAREMNRLPVEVERAFFEFDDDDYRTLAPRLEHSHGVVKHGPDRVI